jgi:transposase
MQEYIALDVHKHYTFAGREEVGTRRAAYDRLEHTKGIFKRYLAEVEPGTTVALEATGNWYWVVDEIEASGMKPALIHPYKAKVMLGCINKTDKLDVMGMNRLQRTGTLPTVWIPPIETRDQRELPRTRMFLTQLRAKLKNRIQATLTKYALNVTGYSDSFGQEARKVMEKRIEELPPQAKKATQQLLELLDPLEEQIQDQEKRIQELVKVTPEMDLLVTMPCIGKILAIVIASEVGDIRRFPKAENYTSYAGTAPRIKASGDKYRIGRLRADVNHYLKWAYIEAANCVCMHQRNFPDRHVTLLYKRIARRKGHPKAIGAVARHLAEATFYVLSRNQPYRDPALSKRVVTTGT